MGGFISEDDLSDFPSWMNYQGVDPSSLSASDLKLWRRHFDDKQRRVGAAPKFGRMNLKPLAPGEYRYAVAVEEEGQLWLVLWVRRTTKGEFFVMVPRDSEWDPHSSYHLDGTFHAKSYGQKFPSVSAKQPLDGLFSGRESLGSYAGFGPKSVGAVADEAQFSHVLVVRPGVLGPKHGRIDVDLVEPGIHALPTGDDIDTTVTMRDFAPWLDITVRRST